MESHRCPAAGDLAVDSGHNNNALAVPTDPSFPPSNSAFQKIIHFSSNHQYTGSFGVESFNTGGFLAYSLVVLAAFLFINLHLERVVGSRSQRGQEQPVF